MAKGLKTAKRTKKRIRKRTAKRSARRAVKRTARRTVKRLVLIRYGEIFLKSAPVRREYEKRLKENIKTGLKNEKIADFKISRTRGRIFIEMPGKKTHDSFDVLRKTFGIVSFSACWHLQTAAVKDIQKFVRSNYRKWIKRGQTFAVRARRSGTQKERYTSMQLAKKVGDVVNRKVNLSIPDVEIFVEVRDNDTYVYTEILDGPGGLPVGTAGRVVCLISGGIDSAVAAWLMMKRGCSVIALYADNWPYVSDRKNSNKRVADVLEVLQSWSAGWYMPAFTYDNGKTLKRFLENKKASQKFICLLCKRMMYMVANELAKQQKAKAIVTGETLGEVASQTLDNLAVLDEASKLPVFRPLLGNDKQETIELAKRIGTYDKSISGGGKCLAVPATPRTRGKISEIKSIESELPMKKLLRESTKSLKKIKIL